MWICTYLQIVEMRIMPKILTLKGLCFIGMALCASYIAKAQQDPSYTHFVQFVNGYNPGAVGMKDGLCINGIFRRQYTSFQDQSPSFKNPPGNYLESEGPKTEGINLAMPVTIKRRSQYGVGLNILNDRVGAESTLGLRGQFAYRKKYKSGTTISGGLDLGLMQRTLDGTKFNPLDPNDPNVPTSEVSSNMAMDLGLGLYYLNPNFNNLFVGLSTTHLLGGTLEYEVGQGALVQTAIVPHYYLVSGAEYVINPSITLYPAVLFKTDLTKNQIDLQAMALFQEKFRGGLGYRTGPTPADALSVMLGYHAMPNLYVGYAYDITVFNSVIGGNNNGSHEFFVTYCTKINFKTSDKRYYTPRFMGGYN